MKNFTNTLVRISLITVMLFILQKNSFAVIYSINNVLSGAQENPPVAGGNGTVVGTYNTATKIISYTITFNVTGTTTAGHFHGPAAVGVNAGVQMGFVGLPLGVTSGSFSSSTAALSATQETQLLSGLWYTNIHTSTFGGGAIRGQVTPVALSNLSLTYLIEGLYNDGSNLMVADTVTVNLRSIVSPYPVISTAKAFLSTSGTASVNFTNAVNGTNYYLQMLHRNALATYSNATFSFTANAGTFDFTTANTQALGNNLVLKGSEYCAFSGDVDQSGFIEITDLIEVTNDASNFAGGYIDTDLDGDLLVGITDQLICYNNVINFVTAITP